MSTQINIVPPFLTENSILIDKNDNEIFIKDINEGTVLKTDIGNSLVVRLIKMKIKSKIKKFENIGIISDVIIKYNNKLFLNKTDNYLESYYEGYVYIVIMENLGFPMISLNTYFASWCCNNIDKSFSNSYIYTEDFKNDIIKNCPNFIVNFSMNCFEASYDNAFINLKELAKINKQKSYISILYKFYNPAIKIHPIINEK
jgi:hypothetical protein